MAYYQATGDVIRAIIHAYGIQALYDSHFTIDVFAKLAPNLEKERPLLIAFLACGGAEKIIRVMSEPLHSQKNCIDGIVRSMQEDQWIDLPAAQYICSEVYRALTNQRWEFDAYDPPHRSFFGFKVIISVLAILLIALTAYLFLTSGSGGSAFNSGRDNPAINSEQDDPTSDRNFLQAFQHEHSWVKATCQSPKTCSDCGETEGSALGHDWNSATCKAPRTCARCGETDGVKKDHQWQAATCESPRKCASCGQTDGTALDHAWERATYDNPRTCSRCGETTGRAVPSDELKRIKDIYYEYHNARKENPQDFPKEDVAPGIDFFYDEYGELRYIAVKRGTDGIGQYSDTYSRMYTFCNGELIFAFFEGRDMHRMYFYDELMIRWQYAPSNGGDTVYQDFSFTEEYLAWEKLALDEVNYIRSQYIYN